MRAQGGTTASIWPRFMVSTIACVVISACASDPSQPKEVTWDGLELVEREGFDKVYIRPGASLARYKRVILRPATVSFDQNWQPRWDGWGSNSEVDPNRIAREVEESFNEITVRELQKGSYQIVTFPDDDVLRVVPSITDLYVRFPNQSAPGSGPGVLEAGHMTLVVELRESTTNTALARVIDRMDESTEDHMDVGSSSPNRAAGERIMTKWAVALREALDRANAAPPTAGKQAEPKN